jgi:hypothetical protein
MYVTATVAICASIGAPLVIPETPVQAPIPAFAATWD